jgi:hypothetical protein
LVISASGALRFCDAKFLTVSEADATEGVKGGDMTTMWFR